MLFHHQAMDGLDDLDLDDEVRGLFLAGNAQRLLELPVPSSP
ncbi:MAG TPA: hypothetical protein VES62_14350 [Thermoleophilaceae bacterium]|nr:hypothetical protein [Thermoleophilaceae bacterium]